MGLQLISDHPWLFLIYLAASALMPFVLIDKLNLIALRAGMGWHIPTTFETWFAIAIVIILL